MNQRNLIIFLVLITLLSFSMQKFGPSKKRKHEETIVYLNETNFDQIVQSHNNLLIEFTEEKCKLCKTLSSILSKLSHESIEKKWDLTFAKVDGPLNPGIVSKFKIEKEAYPTLFFYSHKNDIQSEYHGEISYHEIFKFISYLTNFDIKEINAMEDIPLFVGKAKVSHVILFIGDRNKFKSQYESIHQNFHDLQKFAIFSTKQNSLFNKFNVSLDSFDVVFFDVKNKSDRKLKRNEEKLKEKKDREYLKIEIDEGVKMNLASETNLNKEAFMNYLHGFVRPLIGKLDDQSLHYVFEYSETTLILVSNNKEDKNVLKEVAKKYRGKIFFLFGLWTGKKMERFDNFFHIEKSNLPQLIILKHEENNVDNLAKFKSEVKVVNHENIENFITNFYSNSAPRFYYSEQIPESNPDKYGIHRIVLNSLNSFLSDTKKDLLVLFCSHFSKKCERMVRLYEILAYKLGSNSNFIIGELDPSLNEVVSLKIKEIPKLILYPGSETSNDIEARINSQIEYQGNLSLYEIITWITSNVKSKLEIKDLKEKEKRYIKQEKKEPVVQEDQQEKPLSFYGNYGKNLIIGDFEDENSDQIEEEDDLLGVDEDPKKKHKNKYYDDEDNEEEEDHKSVKKEKRDL